MNTTNPENLAGWDTQTLSKLYISISEAKKQNQSKVYLNGFSFDLKNAEDFLKKTEKRRWDEQRRRKLQTVLRQ